MRIALFAVSMPRASRPSQPRTPAVRSPAAVPDPEICARLRDLWINSRTACYLFDSVRDRDGRIVDFVIRHINEEARSFARLYLDKRDVLGRSLSQCCPSFWNFAEQLKWMATVVETGETLFTPPIGLSSRGEERYFVKTAIKSGDGVALLFRDATPQVTNEKRLLENQAEILEAQRLGSIGSWQWNCRTDEVIWSPECYHIFRADPSKPPPGFEHQKRFYDRRAWKLLRAAVQNALRSAKSYDLELETRREDGGACWIRARGEVRRDAAGKIIGLRGTAQDVTDRKANERRMQMLAQQVLMAQESERRRVAGELHDGVSQVLVSCLYRLHAAGNATGRKRALSLAAARKGVADSLQEIRLISHGLRPKILDDLGLYAALRDLVREFEQRTKIAVTLLLPKSKRRLAENLELVFFRVTQEALINIERHARAQWAEIGIVRRGENMCLVVRDNGRGFSTESGLRRSSMGLGLNSMRERAEQVGGTFDLSSVVGQGTVISVNLPLLIRPRLRSYPERAAR
jgi:signal transduction histidine kinase